MKKSQLKKLVKEIIQEAKLKNFYVAADIPGNGWNTTVKAISPEAAKHRANFMHSGQPPADTVREVPDDFEETEKQGREVRRQYEEALAKLEAKFERDKIALRKRFNQHY